MEMEYREEGLYAPEYEYRVEGLFAPEFEYRGDVTTGCGYTIWRRAAYTAACTRLLVLVLVKMLVM